MDYNQHIADREKKREWVNSNQERIDILTDDVISGMDERDMLTYVRDALEDIWADYPEGFEIEWKEYKDREGVDNQ